MLALDTDQSPPTVLVIGVGNISRGDDAVGLMVARHLRPVCADGVRIVERPGEATDLIEIVRFEFYFDSGMRLVQGIDPLLNRRERVFGSN